MIQARHEQKSKPTALVAQDTVCFGCENDFSCLVISSQKGFRSQLKSRVILGPRFKSIVEPTVDLCSSCEESGLFQSHGPFLKIVDPSTAPEAILCVFPGDNSKNKLDNIDWRNPLAGEFTAFVRQRQQKAFSQDRDAYFPKDTQSSHETLETKVKSTFDEQVVFPSNDLSTTTNLF